MKTLTVDLAERSYPIYIGAGIFDDLALYTPHIVGKQVLIVTNTTVAELYLQPLKAVLSTNYQVDEVILADGEQYKNLETLNQIFDALLTKQHNRTTTLIALGGGVVGDMCGFAAACYQRGVNFIQVPTTLLSQVDSSVGGKTGVNHALGKNMLGAFYQPKAVIADTQTLSTLPERELSAGIAEVIKYGLIYDAAFYEWLQQHMADLMQQQPAALAYAIERSCQVKAEVVAQDEREGGIRAILNLGHTFGHAIEAEQGYGNWLHGEAVAAGMMMAADLSKRSGQLTSADLATLKALLLQAKLPVTGPQEMSSEQYLTHMKLDKKVLDGSIRLVLLEKIGHAIVTNQYDSALLLQTLAAGEQLGV